MDDGHHYSVFQVRNRGLREVLCAHKNCDEEYGMKVYAHSLEDDFGGAIRALPDDGSLVRDVRNYPIHGHSDHNDDEALDGGRPGNPRSDLGNTSLQKVLFHSLEALAC